MDNKAKRVQKLITFSPQLYRLARRKAEQVGISFPEFIRYLVVIAVEKEVEYIPMVDRKTEERIAKSLKALEKGKYIEVNPTDERALNAALGIK